ncbi:MAG: hypothetical protein U9R19_06905 [Bacteroidota bacterium]|nr:hypothetical protein [Bacteroidota bacterium]
MAIGGFFRLPRHKQFEFRPRYYDADKEDLDQRVKSAEQEVKGYADKKYLPNIRGKMGQHLIDQKKSQSPYARIRKIIIVISVFMLALLFYYLINFFDILIISDK